MIVRIAMAVCLSLVCSRPAFAGGGQDFIRGDANADAQVNLGDAIFILNALFGLGAAPDCPDAADVNDDGLNDVSDAVYLLTYLFVAGGVTPPEPFPVPGMDPTGDGLLCGVLCVDAASFESLFTSVFPLPVCVPMGSTSGTGYTVDFCTQTSSPSCFGAAGCEGIVTLNSFDYDVAVLTGTANLTITIDPVGITYDTLLGSGSCDGSLVLVVDVTLLLDGTEIVPGVTEVTDLSVDITVVSTDLDVSACGVLGLVAGSFVDLLVAPLESQFEVLAEDQLGPFIIGTPLCTP